MSKETTAPELSTETRVGTVYVWTRPSGDFALRLDTRTPCVWPTTGESNVARIASALGVLNVKLGTDLTEAEAKTIAQRLAKKARAGVRNSAPKYAQQPH